MDLYGHIISFNNGLRFITPLHFKQFWEHKKNFILAYNISRYYGWTYMICLYMDMYYYVWKLRFRGTLCLQILKILTGIFGKTNEQIDFISSPVCLYGCYLV